VEPLHVSWIVFDSVDSPGYFVAFLGALKSHFQGLKVHLEDKVLINRAIISPLKKQKKKTKYSSFGWVC